MISANEVLTTVPLSCQKNESFKETTIKHFSSSQTLGCVVECHFYSTCGFMVRFLTGKKLLRLITKHQYFLKSVVTQWIIGAVQKMHHLPD